jgi:hypothetical protein
MKYFPPMNEVKITIHDGSKITNPPLPMSVRYERLLFLAEMFPKTHNLFETGQSPLQLGTNLERIDKTPDTKGHPVSKVKYRRFRNKKPVMSEETD